MSELASWVLAQLDADEAVARAAMRGPWEAWSGASSGGGEYISSVDSVRGYTFGISPGVMGEKGWEMARADAAHIAAHDPARVLVEVEAKRAIVERVCSSRQVRRPTDVRGRYDVVTVWEPMWEADGEAIVRLLALPYADRPGFDETWRP